MFCNKESAQDQAITWLAKLNSQQLTPAQEQEFFTWLQASPLHQSAYIRAEHLWERGAVLARLPNPSPVSHSPRGVFGLSLAACGACGVFAIVVAGFLFEAPANTLSFDSPIGEQKKVVLDDGSEATLNADSHLDVTYNRKHRIANLTRGEVFFDVQRDNDRPFDIHTPLGRVRVLGTHFAVRQTAEDTIVTVLDGKVALGKPSTENDNFTPVAVLENNQQSSVRQASLGAPPISIDAKSVLAWRNKQLIFKNQKLSAVIAELNHYFSSDIQLADPSQADREITAVIQLSDLPNTLKTLSQPLGLHPSFSATGNQVLLETEDSNKNN